MKLSNLILTSLICVMLGMNTSILAQNSNTKVSPMERAYHFGRSDKLFLWGVSGEAVIPFSTPQEAFSNMHLKMGYAFGLDFRHRIGYQNHTKYFVFIHYGMKIGSFFCNITQDITNTEEGDYYSGHNSISFLHLDIPIGLELPIYYLRNNRLSFSFQTTLTSRFYFFSPNRIYNIATTNGIAIRFDKFQIQASYSYYFLPQLSYSYFSMEDEKWKISEINVGLKFYF